MPPRILVAADAPVSSDFLVRILRCEGFSAFVADSAASVLDQCAAGNADLILLDARLADRSGFELCAELKAQPRTSEIPVIFISAADDAPSRLAGFNAGGVDYIPKPFVAREAIERVRVHLRLRANAECLRRRQKEQLEELRRAQQAILVTPETFPEGAFAVYYQPLEAVGGDFYDVLPLGGGALGYFVADISGHGVAASFLTSAVKTLLREYASPLYSIEEAMRHMNSVLRAVLSEGRYLTACYARLAPGRRILSVVSAGHLPAIVVSAGEARPARAASDPLGVYGSVELSRQEFDVLPGDRFYLYTDGLVDNMVGGRSKGVERLRAACQRHHQLPLEQGVRAIAFEASGGVAPQDDILLLGAGVAQ